MKYADAVVDAGPTHRDDDGEECEGDRERGERDLVGVREGDDQQRHDVVDDHQRQQEHADAGAGSRRPTSARTPSANAVSVPITMPQPFAPGSPALKAR